MQRYPRLPKLRKLTGLLLLIGGLCMPLHILGIHLVGGSMSYDYIGPDGLGGFNYRVTLKIYRDCSKTTALDGACEVGVYQNTAGFPIYRTYNIALISQKFVNPPSGANCPSAPAVCIEEGIYSSIIALPASSTGYHLAFQRCCRNTQVNILDDNGQTYYAFIPSTAIVNSSPYFTDVPAPYICRADTSTYLNAATDPDGDSLSYKLVWPWAGASSGQAVWTPPFNLPQPFPNVIYRSSYNSAIPFGSSGLASIDANTGLTTMLSHSNGLFSIAIEVSEWRNGVKLSTIRLDVQMIVLACLPNNIPIVTTDEGTYTYEVTAGETLCFNVTTTDIDIPTQNIKLSGRGEVMGNDAGWTGPKATFTTGSAPKTVTRQFCWTPACSQVRLTPYNFVVDAVDDGCPPKNRTVGFTILVKPFTGSPPASISGPAIVCTGDNGKIYRIATLPGVTYKWSVTGGTIVGNDALSTITVDWGTAGTGKLSVVQTSPSGCIAKPAEYEITISPYPVVQNIPTDSACRFKNKLFSAANNAGSSYNWWITGGTIAAQPTPYQIEISWADTGTGVVKFIETNAAGCVADTSTTYVVVTKPMVDSIYGSQSVCPNIHGVEYFTKGSPESLYRWFIEGGTIVAGDSTPKITVNWGGPGYGKIKLLETTKWGCTEDTLVIRVLINHVLQGYKPVGNDSLCEYTKNVVYEVVNTKGSEYFWHVTGGKIIKDDTTYTVTIDWGPATGTLQQVSVYEISYDSVNNIPCIGAPVLLDIWLHPLPLDLPIHGKPVICQQQGPQTYSLNGYPGSVYTWSVDGDTTGITGQGTNTISLSINTVGNYRLAVQEMSAAGCPGPIIDTLLTVLPRPVTKPIEGDTIVCYPYFEKNHYKVNGFAGSIFDWQVNAGIVDSGNGTPHVLATFFGNRYNTINVVETTKDGCIGDTQTMNVYLDRPYLKIRYVSVGFPDNHIKVAWQLDSVPNYQNNFEILRRPVLKTAGANPQWARAGITPGTVYTFTDTNLNTDNNAFEYRVKGINRCGTEFFSAPHTNILLTNTVPENYDVFVNWSRYIGWESGVRNYEVYRKTDFENTIVKNRDIGTDTTSYFDDGVKNFVHYYRVKGWENGNNNDTSWSNELEVKFKPVLWVPNAFTPNGDGFNNTFIIGQASIKTFEITIFNRWGENIFTTDSVTNNWDGTFKGEPCPQDVYGYVLRYTGADNVPQILAGNITLLR